MHAHELQTSSQVASQSEPSCELASAEYEAQGHRQTDESTQFKNDYGVACYWTADEQDYVEPAEYASSVPQSIAHGHLQRVSTTTRGRYFQREIVDLDDLDEPVGNGGDAVRREKTVQVRMSSSADSDDVKWSHHRFPQTQYHCDTQAEPMTQEEDQVLVQETPPELFHYPQTPCGSHQSGTAFETPQGCQLAYVAPFPHKVNKPRKVYGRKR